MFKPESLPLSNVESLVIDAFATVPDESLYQNDVHKLVDPVAASTDPSGRVITKYQLRKALLALVDAGQLHRREETTAEHAARMRHMGIHMGATAHVYSLNPALPEIDQAHLSHYAGIPAPRTLQAVRRARTEAPPLPVEAPAVAVAPVETLDPRVQQALDLLLAFAGESVSYEAEGAQQREAALRMQVADRDELITRLKASLGEARAQLKAIHDTLNAVRPSSV